MPRTDDTLMQFPIPKDVIVQRIEQIKECIHDAVISIHELGFEDKESIEKYQEIQRIIFELRDSQSKLQSILNQYDDNKLDELEDMSSYGACFIDSGLMAEKKFLFEKLEQSKTGIKELQKLQSQLLANKYKSKPKPESMFNNQSNSFKSVNGQEFRSGATTEGDRKPSYSQSTLPFMRDQKASSSFGSSSESIRLKQILQEKELELEKIASEITLLKMRKQGDISTNAITQGQVPKNLENILYDLQKEVEARRDLRKINESYKWRSNNDLSIAENERRFYNLDDQDEREAFHRNVTEKLLEIQSTREKLFELGKQSNRSSSSLQYLQENPQFSDRDRNKFYSNMTAPSMNNDVSFIKSAVNKSGDNELNIYGDQKLSFNDYIRYSNPNGRNFMTSDQNQNRIKRKSHRQLFPDASPLERLYPAHSNGMNGIESLSISHPKELVLTSDEEDDEDLKNLALKTQIFKNTQMLKEVENALNVLNDSSSSAEHTLLGSQRSHNPHPHSESNFSRNRIDSLDFERNRGFGRNVSDERTFELWPSFSSLSNARLSEPSESENNIQNSNQPVGSRPVKVDESRKNATRFFLDKFMNDTSSRLEVFDITLKIILDQQKKTLEEIFLLFEQLHNRMERNERTLIEIKEFVTRPKKNDNFQGSGRAFTGMSNLNHHGRMYSESTNSNIPQPKIFNPTVLYGQQNNSEYSQPFVPVRELWHPSDQSCMLSNNSFVDLSYLDSPNPNHIQHQHHHQQQRNNMSSYPNQENVLQGIQLHSSMSLSNNHSSSNLYHRNESPIFQRHAMSNQSSNSMLNNQVPHSGTRANNYWDNFRSYSRQNMLSSPKSGSGTQESGANRITALEENGFGVFQQANNRYDPRSSRVGYSGTGPNNTNGNNNNKSSFWSNSFVENVGTKKRNKEQKSQSMPLQYRSNSSNSDNLPNDGGASQTSGILSQQNDEESFNQTNAGRGIDSFLSDSDGRNSGNMVRPLERSKIQQTFENETSEQLSNMQLTANYLDAEIFAAELIERIENETVNNSIENNIEGSEVTNSIDTSSNNHASISSNNSSNINQNSDGNTLTNEISSNKKDNLTDITNIDSNRNHSISIFGNSGEDEGIVNDCMDISHSSNSSPIRDLNINSINEPENLFLQDQENSHNSHTSPQPQLGREPSASSLSNQVGNNVRVLKERSAFARQKGPPHRFIETSSSSFVPVRRTEESSNSMSSLLSNEPTWNLFDPPPNPYLEQAEEPQTDSNSNEKFEAQEK